MTENILEEKIQALDAVIKFIELNSGNIHKFYNKTDANQTLNTILPLIKEDLQTARNNLIAFQSRQVLFEEEGGTLPSVNND